LERDLLLRARRQLRLALAERERLVAAALHLAHEEDPEADDEEERAPGVEDGGPRADGRLLGGDLDAAIDQLVDEALVLRRRVGLEMVVRLGEAVDFLAGDGDARDAARIGLLHELAEVHGPRRARLELGREIPDEDAQDNE